MLCPKCHAENAENNIFCGKCGAKLGDFPVVEEITPAEPPVQVQQPAQVQQPVPVQVPVDTHLTMSILCAIFCCTPFAIPAIVFASLANGCVHRQDLVGAQRNAAKANMWCWISFGVGIASNITYVLFEILSIAAEC